MKALLALAFWLSTASIAVAADEVLLQAQVAPSSMTVSAVAPVLDALPADQIQLKVIDKPLVEKLTDGTFLAQLLIIFGALLAFMRGLAEALTRLSVRFPGVSKPAQLVSDATWILGAFLGKFGHGEPKLVTAEKAKAIVQKEMSNGPAAEDSTPKAS